MNRLVGSPKRKGAVSLSNSKGGGRRRSCSHSSGGEIGFDGGQQVGSREGSDAILRIRRYCSVLGGGDKRRGEQTPRLRAAGREKPEKAR